MTLNTLKMESVRLLSPFNGNPLLVILAMALGVLLYALGGMMLVGAQPSEVAVNRIAIVTAAPGVLGRALEVRVIAPESKNCTRTSQEFLFQDIGGQRFYYPLGSVLNGRGFTGAQQDFTLVLSLPSTLKEGDYFFIQRAAYDCDWLGGFLSRRMTYQTPQRLVHLGPGPGA